MAANPRWPPFFSKSGVLVLHFGNNSKCVCLINTKTHTDIYIITMLHVSCVKIVIIPNDRQIQDGRHFQQNRLFWRSPDINKIKYR